MQEDKNDTKWHKFKRREEELHLKQQWKNHLLLHCLLFLGTMIVPLEVNLCRTWSLVPSERVFEDSFHRFLVTSYGIIFFVLLQEKSTRKLFLSVLFRELHGVKNLLQSGKLYPAGNVRKVLWLVNSGKIYPHLVNIFSAYCFW